MLKNIGAVILGFFAAIFGGAPYLVMMGIGIMGIPLNVISWMRLFGWEWWWALIATVIVGVIPLVGQLAFIGLALIGAYFFISSDFSWQVATGQALAVVSLSKLTAEELEAYKKNTLTPQFLDECKAEAVQRYGINGKLPIALANFCECYVRVALNHMTQNELTYQEQNGHLRSELTPAIFSDAKAQCAVFP
jgi:hypothetical protein